MQNPLDPQTEYNVPKGDSKYLKLEKGETEFLPLDSAIVGFVYWNLDGKPVRLTEEPKTIPKDIRKDNDGLAEAIKHFWAFPVWDVQGQGVKILEITQKTVMQPLRDYTKNPKWGSPIMKYSFTVSRSGDNFETKYTIMANPAETINQEITDKWDQVKADGFDLNRLFTNGDPFTASDKVGNTDVDYPREPVGEPNF
jgi:hypothetical protein